MTRWYKYKNALPQKKINKKALSFVPSRAAHHSSREGRLQRRVCHASPGGKVSQVHLVVASLLLIFERLHVGFFFCFFQVTLQGSLLVPVLPAGRGGLLHFSCFGHLVRGVEGFVLLLWPLLQQAEGEGRVVIFDIRAVNST